MRIRLDLTDREIDLLRALLKKAREEEQKDPSAAAPAGKLLRKLEAALWDRGRSG